MDICGVKNHLFLVHELKDNLFITFSQLQDILAQVHNIVEQS